MPPDQSFVHDVASALSECRDSLPTAFGSLFLLDLQGDVDFTLAILILSLFMLGFEGLVHLDLWQDLAWLELGNLVETNERSCRLFYAEVMDFIFKYVGVLFHKVFWITPWVLEAFWNDLSIEEAIDVWLELLHLKTLLEHMVSLGYIRKVVVEGDKRIVGRIFKKTSLHYCSPI